MSVALKTEYPFGDGSKTPLMLTSGTCEPTHEYVEALFVELGLQGDLIPEGDDIEDAYFYPLTEAESQFIGEDVVPAANGFEAYTGYSSLYQGQKFISPIIELPYGDDASADQVFEFGRAYAEEMKAKLAAIGGTALFDEDGGIDRAQVMVMVPVTFPPTVAVVFEAWKAYLENEILPSDLKIVAGMKM